MKPIDILGIIPGNYPQIHGLLKWFHRIRYLPTDILQVEILQVSILQPDTHQPDTHQPVIP